MGYMWRPTGRTFTIVGNECPLTRITLLMKCLLGETLVLDPNHPRPVVYLVYSRIHRKNKNTDGEVVPKSRPLAFGIRLPRIALT
ncbi:hypothetical protein Tco_0091798 [Tanacetum coccineum]